MDQRLSLAADSGLFEVPAEGRIAVFAPTIDTDLRLFPQDRTDLICYFYPLAHAFTQAGWTVRQAPDGRYAMAVVQVPRSKLFARALVAQATFCCDGVVVVDGAKTDGIDSLFKACKQTMSPSSAYSKAHGKTFVLPAGSAVSEWTITGPTQTLKSSYPRPHRRRNTAIGRG